MRFCSLVLLVFLSAAANVQASVVMNATRVVFPAAAGSKTVQFSNPDNFPYLLQIWLDSGKEEQEPGEEELPFLPNPPIFRMEPHSGQTVRLLLADDSNLPKDRESLFFLNFSQLPAQKEQSSEDNQLLLLLNSRLKLFYRPKELPEAQPDMQQLACSLRFAVDGGQLRVSNPSVFHAVVTQAELQQGERRTLLFAGQTLAPLAEQVLPLETPLGSSQGAQLHLRLINDFGAAESYLCPWH